jgi:hypothetical protein
MPKGLKLNRIVNSSKLTAPLHGYHGYAMAPVETLHLIMDTLPLQLAYVDIDHQKRIN